MLITLIACQTTPAVINNYYQTFYQTPEDTGIESVDSEESDTGWQEIDPPNALEATVTPVELDLQPFAEDGVVYWFDVAEDQVTQMNSDWEEGEWGWWGALYGVDDGQGDDTYADHLYVMTPDLAVADYGQVAVNVVGQSSGTTWTSTTIPNLSLDANEFEDGQYFDYPLEMDHMRLNNAQVGSMFGEPLALQIWEAAGYAAPQTAYAFVGGTPWQQSELLIPMVAVEVYKSSFCDEHADFFGGGCSNIWEWWGYDITVSSVSSINDGCELHDGCDVTQLTALASAVDDHLYQEGFEAATADYFDWPTFQTQLCLSWYTQTGDDYIHNLNNAVLIQGDDGKLRIMPYSVDINAGLAWGGAWTGMDLWGWSAMSLGCEYDSQCFEETIDTCSELLDQMETLDPANSLLPDLYERLQNTAAPWGEDGGDGMLRSADDGEYAVAYAFYADRVETAREELATYSDPGCPWWDTGIACADTGSFDTGSFDTATDTAIRDTGAPLDTAAL